jgi:selenocysteine-specific elongation factor
VWLREGEEGRVASRRRALASVQRTLEQNEFAPPPPEELARIAGGAEEFRALMQSGELIRLSDEVVFTRQAFERARQMIIKTLQEEGEITVARARDVLGSTRKYLLPLLNRLDEEKVTIRRGEVRVLR